MNKNICSFHWLRACWRRNIPRTQVFFHRQLSVSSLWVLDEDEDEDLGERKGKKLKAERERWRKA